MRVQVILIYAPPQDPVFKSPLYEPTSGSGFHSSYGSTGSAASHSASYDPARAPPFCSSYDSTGNANSHSASYDPARAPPFCSSYGSTGNANSHSASYDPARAPPYSPYGSTGSGASHSASYVPARAPPYSPYGSTGSGASHSASYGSPRAPAFNSAPYCPTFGPDLNSLRYELIRSPNFDPQGMAPTSTELDYVRAMFKACSECGELNHKNSSSCNGRNCPQNRMK